MTDREFYIRLLATLSVAIVVLWMIVVLSAVNEAVDEAEHAVDLVERVWGAMTEMHRTPITVQVPVPTIQP